MLPLNAFVFKGRGHVLNWGVDFRGGSEIVLAGPSEPARELLHLLDLETLWAIYDSRTEAVDALSGD